MLTTKKNAVIYFIALTIIQIQVGAIVANGQESSVPLADLIQANKNEIFHPVSPFNISSDESIFSFVKTGTVLTLKDAAIEKILAENSVAITLTIPSITEGTLDIELVKADLGGDYLNVTLKGDQSSEKIKIFSGLHYRGIIKG